MNELSASTLVFSLPYLAERTGWLTKKDITDMVGMLLLLLLFLLHLISQLCAPVNLYVEHKRTSRWAVNAHAQYDCKLAKI